MIATVLFAAAMAAQPTTAPPPQTTAPHARDKRAHGTKTDKNAAPDADLIGFLGDYEDAADGLDPIGLSEQMNDADDTAVDAKKKDGHGP